MIKKKIKKAAVKKPAAKKLTKKIVVKKAATFKPNPVVVLAPPSKLPAWEIALGVMHPTIKRPRRTSLHTLAAVVGAKDPLALAKEMKESGKVVGYVCPDVKTPIFYLKSLAKHPGMIDTRDSKVWGKLEKFFEKNPYPAVKGFKRFVNGTWSSGKYGIGKYISGNSAMDRPYEKADFVYGRSVIKALKTAGYKSGLTAADLK